MGVTITPLGCQRMLYAPIGCKLWSQHPNDAFITSHYGLQHLTSMVYLQHSMKVDVTTKPLGCYPLSNTQRVCP